MPVEIRQAQDADVRGIVAVKRAAWPDEITNPDYVARAMRNTDHTTFVAAQGKNVVGFVDGFLTLSADNVRRWEIDLLAVHPLSQGAGIATQLVMASMNAGQTRGALSARTLVGVDNIVSQRTFARCNFTKNPERYALYIGNDLPGDFRKHKAHLISVSTMNYRGVWIEGELTSAGLSAALAMCSRYQWDVAGAVIPLSQHSVVQAAEESGYALAGHYEWWQLDLRKT